MIPFLFLDDLYHIRRADQAQVIDYFHRIAKGSNLWLKIGTIRHRTKWYVHGDPPIGIKLADDADEIDRVEWARVIVRREQHWMQQIARNATSEQW